MRHEQVAIATEFIRLDALLKFSGAFDTGGQAKLAIQGGSVRANGGPCTLSGKKMRPGDRAEAGGVVYEVVKACGC